ncbi:MAG TPA: MBL fold metallo-hydrolase [Chlamydiales bacterium]|nr:MBL fold metallo-hydrolase [Chlamydiales bacterium]
MILYKFPSGPFKTNTILIGCSKTKIAAVIDPAYQSTTQVLDFAQKEQLTIEKILFTHSHWDHFADAFILKQHTGADLYIHELDAPNLQAPGSDGLPIIIPIKPVKPDHFVKEGDWVKIGEISFQVIHTPGHSPGGVCYYSSENKLLISGDTLFCGSIGNTQFPTSNPEDMWTSLKKIGQLPPETIVIPGHGPNTTISAEKRWLS